MKKLILIAFVFLSLVSFAQTTDREMTDEEKILLGAYADFQNQCKQTVRNRAVFLNNPSNFSSLTTSAGAVNWAQQQKIAADVVANPIVPDDGQTVAQWIINASKGRTFDLPTAPATVPVMLAEWIQENAFAEFDQVYFKIKGQETKYYVGN